MRKHILLVVLLVVSAGGTGIHPPEEKSIDSAPEITREKTTENLTGVPPESTLENEKTTQELPYTGNVSMLDVRHREILAESNSFRIIQHRETRKHIVSRGTTSLESFVSATKSDEEVRYTYNRTYGNGERSTVHAVLGPNRSNQIMLLVYEPNNGSRVVTERTTLNMTPLSQSEIYGSSFLLVGPGVNYTMNGRTLYNGTPVTEYVITNASQLEHPRVQNASAVLHVTRDGLVKHVRWNITYVKYQRTNSDTQSLVQSGPLRVEVTMVYEHVVRINESD